MKKLHEISDESINFEVAGIFYVKGCPTRIKKEN